jgi:hypothetical protein
MLSWGDTSTALSRALKFSVTNIKMYSLCLSFLWQGKGKITTWWPSKSALHFWFDNDNKQNLGARHKKLSMDINRKHSYKF